MESPIGLPTVTIDGITYYFDARLHQLRNVRNPHDFVDLSLSKSEAVQFLIDNEKVKDGHVSA